MTETYPQTTPNALAPSLQTYLAGILDRWVIAKAEEAAAKERAEALGREVKDACLAAGIPNTTLTDTSGRPVARFEKRTPWRLDTKRLKSEHPEVYAAYAAQGSETRLEIIR